ncbi:MAG: hypothetical protein HN341_11980 [Verrucomicrobia bacterium]|jgi:hypothetical protein|nr:hypothetical protein [Verrucomicrobiota bacterium]
MSREQESDNSRGTAPAVGLVDEAWELMVDRTVADLHLRPCAHATALAELAERLDHADAPAYASLRRVADLVTPPLRDLALSPNVRLGRERRLTQLNRVQRMDATCVRWLARRPGKDVSEKAARGQRVLAVQRRLHADLPENRVVGLLVRRLNRGLLPFSGERGGLPPALAGQVSALRAAVQSWLGTAVREDIRELSFVPSPNNALRHDTRYRRIWLAFQWLLSENERLDKIGERLDESLAWFLAQLLGVVLTRFGMLPVECGFWPDGTGPCPRVGVVGGLWVQEEADAFTRVHLSPLGAPPALLLRIDRVRTEATETPIVADISLQRTGEGEIKLVLHSPMGDDGQLPTGMPTVLEQQVDATWHGIGALTDTLTEFLAGALSRRSLPPRSLGERGSTTEAGASVLACFRYTEILALSGGTEFAAPLAAESLGVPDTPSTGPRADKLQVGGHAGALLQRTRVPQALHKDGWELTAGSPLRPHQFERDLLGGEQAVAGLRSVLSEVALAVGADREWFVAYPGSFCVGRYRQFRRAMPESAVSVSLLPQGVAAAFWWAYQGGGKPVLEAGSTLVVLDLAGLCPTAARLQWEESRRVRGEWEWLRKPLERVSFHKPHAEWMMETLRHAAERAGIECDSQGVQRSLCAVDGKTLLELMERGQGETVLWMHVDRDTPERLVISAEDVSTAVTLYVANLRDALRRWRSSISLDVGAHHVLVNGDIARLDIVQEAVRDVYQDAEIPGRDVVAEGLGVFRERCQENLPTWRDYLPSLELQIRNEHGQVEYFTLLGDEEPPEFGHTVTGEERSLVFPAGEERVVLPLRRDRRQAGITPVIELSDPAPKGLALRVQATYEAGRNGLVLTYRSEANESVSPGEVRWEEGLASRPVHTQEIYRPPTGDLNWGKLAQKLRAVSEKFDNELQGASGRGQGDQLRSALDSLNKALADSPLDSSSECWSERCADPMGDALQRLSWFLGIKKADCRSAAFPRDLRPVVRPTSSQAKKAMKQLRKNGELVRLATRCLSRLRAATPRFFVDLCREKLSAKRVSAKERESHEEYIRAAGRIAGTAEFDDAHKKLIHQLLDGLVRANKTLGEERQTPVRPWMWAVGTFLRSHRLAPHGTPTEHLTSACQAILTVIDHLTEQAQLDREVWRDCLFAVMSFRHCTRASNGEEIWGPDGQMADEIIRVLQEVGERSAGDARLAQLDDIQLQSLGIGAEESDAFLGETLPARLAEVWQGRVSVVLRRLRD